MNSGNDHLPSGQVTEMTGILEVSGVSRGARRGGVEKGGDYSMRRERSNSSGFEEAYMADSMLMRPALTRSSRC